MKKLSLLLLVFIASFALNAQTADEILDSYFENIGGKEKLRELKGLKTKVTVNQGGMEFPAERVTLKDGRESTYYQMQGINLYQNVFDGKTLWSSNQMTMKAEKATAEDTENHKLNIGDFPDPFLDYKEKGYSIELMGKETMDGAETFKIKLTQKPETIDGIKVDNISYYYFDTENFVPIATQQEITSGPGKGIVIEEFLSDYQEVDGLYFAFSRSQGAKGQPKGLVIIIDKIEINPEVEDSIFKFPETIEEAKE